MEACYSMTLLREANQGGCPRIRIKQMTLGDESMRQGEKFREAAKGGDSRRQPRFPSLVKSDSAL